MAGHAPRKSLRTVSMLRLQRGQIFISYSTKDTPAVVRMHNELKRAQYRLWMDNSEQGIKIGENFRQALVENMARSSAVIACFSPDYFKSPYCRAEIEQARAENKPIYPVLIRPLNDGDDAKIAVFGLTDVQYAILTPEERWQSGMLKLRRSLPPPNRTAWLQRYAGYLVTLFLGMAIILAGLYLLSAPKPIEESVGVAVTYFTLEDPTISETDANRIVDRFVADLRKAVTDNPPENLAVGFRSPGKLARVAPRVQGNTPDEREASARTIVDGLEVDIVIYGTVSLLPNGTLTLHPEFTIIPQSLGIADELANTHRFGSPIRTSPALSREAEIALLERSQALAEVIKGITYYAAGYYENALSTFIGIEQSTPGYADMAIDDVLLGQ